MAGHQCPASGTPITLLHPDIWDGPNRDKTGLSGKQLVEPENRGTLGQMVWPTFPPPLGDVGQVLADLEHHRPQFQAGLLDPPQQGVSLGAVD